MKVLVIHAHPKQSHSEVQRALAAAARDVKGVTFHDLYGAYPDFNIDAAREQNLLLAHDLIVLQHPFYWYSSPALIKEWQDIVLDFGWAYGPGGDKLHGKFLLTALSTGGSENVYQSEGRNRFTVDELLRPFNQTAYLCGMAYMKPFIVYEGRRLAGDGLVDKVRQYADLLDDLVNGRIDPRKQLADGYKPPESFSQGRHP